MNEPLLTWLRALGFDRANDAADEIEKLQAVVDAARKWSDYREGRVQGANGFAVADNLEAALRALDGEVKP